MQVKSTENGTVYDLTAIDAGSGVEWTADLLGNYGAFNPKQFDRNEDDEIVAPQAEIEWWIPVIDNLNKGGEMYKEAKDRGLLTDIEERELQDLGNLDLDDWAAAQVQYLEGLLSDNEHAEQRTAEVEQANQVDKFVINGQTVEISVREVITDFSPSLVVMDVAVNGETIDKDFSFYADGEKNISANDPGNYEDIAEACGLDPDELDDAQIQAFTEVYEAIESMAVNAGEAEYESEFDILKDSQPDFECGAFLAGETIYLYANEGENEDRYFAVSRHAGNNQSVLEDKIIEISEDQYDAAVEAASKFHYGDARRVDALQDLFLSPEELRERAFHAEIDQDSEVRRPSRRQDFDMSR